MRNKLEANNIKQNQEYNNNNKPKYLSLLVLLLLVG